MIYLTDDIDISNRYLCPWLGGLVKTNFHICTVDLEPLVLGTRSKPPLVSGHSGDSPGNAAEWKPVVSNLGN